MTDSPPENSPSPPPPPPPPPEPAGAIIPPRELKRRVLAAMADKVSREILMSIDKTPMTVHDLVKSLNLPQSTIYHKMHELLGEGLVGVEYIAVTREGREVEFFRSSLKSAKIRLDGGHISMKVRLRKLVMVPLAKLRKNRGPGYSGLDVGSVPIPK